LSRVVILCRLRASERASHTTSYKLGMVVEVRAP